MLCSAALATHTGLQVLGMSHLYLDAFPDVLAALPSLKVLYLGALSPAPGPSPASRQAAPLLRRVDGVGGALRRDWAGHAAHAAASVKRSAGGQQCGRAA